MTHRPLASASVTTLRNAAAAIVLSTLLVLITPALASAAGINNFNRETYSYSSSLNLASEAGSTRSWCCSRPTVHWSTRFTLLTRH